MTSWSDGSDGGTERPVRPVPVVKPRDRRPDGVGVGRSVLLLLSVYVVLAVLGFGLGWL